MKDETSERRRMPAEAREALVMMMAAEAALEKADGQLTQIARRVPNGYRDYRLATTRLAALRGSLLNTIPVDQLKTMFRTLEIYDLRLTPKTKSRSQGDVWVMERRDIAELIAYAIRGNCLMCAGDVQGCRLLELMRDAPIEEIPDAVVPCLHIGMGGL